MSPDQESTSWFERASAQGARRMASPEVLQAQALMAIAEALHRVANAIEATKPS